MSRYGVEEPYEKLKAFTRGRRVTRDSMQVTACLCFCPTISWALHSCSIAGSQSRFPEIDGSSKPAAAPVIIAMLESHRFHFNG